jgi:hypothetical protein
MDHDAILAPEQRRALDRLSSCKFAAEYYLAGGSAVALRLGHRRSLDLDFFSRSPDLDPGSMVGTLKGTFGQVRVIGQTDAALRVQCDGARLDFVRYPYAPLEQPTLQEVGVQVAGLRDLGTMKLAAIARRGICRDFWDLYEILRAGLNLRSLGRDYVARFGADASDLYHVARALTYFADAEKDPAFPAGMTADTWQVIKDHFAEHGPDLLPLTRP